MPTKDLHHRLTADASGFSRGFSRAEQSARALEREMARQEARQARVDAAMTQTGRTMVLAGAAIAAGLALSTRAAIQWESAWAGVAKTLDNATEPQLAILEEQLRGLARELPQSHQEIAAVAAAAGQLGVAAPDIAEFTRTMVDLGVSTNLSSEEAAFAIARMANIMGTSQDDVRRLASTIVDLGNNSATTEADITEMALRISGAGRTIGLTEAQVLSFAATLSSVGVRADAGGTAISKVFLEIDTAVSQGGDTLETFARTAGMSADGFRRAYERDAGQAIAAFLNGLGRVQTTGGDVNKVLSDLGLTEIRVSDALRRVAGAGDLLNSTLQIGSDAWDENIALTEEAERRYGTVEARMGIAKNQLNDFAISIGQTFLPVVGEMVDRGAALVGWLNDLPGPVKSALGIIGGLTAAIALAGGTALIAVPKLAAFRGALDTIENGGGRAAGAVGEFRRGMGAIPWGPVSAGLAAATVGLGIFAAKQAEARAGAEEFADTLDRVTGAITRDTKLKALNNLESEGLVDIAERMGISVATLVDAALDPQSAAMDEVTRKSEAYRKQLEQAGDAIPLLDNDVDTLNQGLQGQNDELAAGRELWRRQNELLDEAAGNTRELSPEVEVLAGAFGISSGEAETLNEELKELDERLRILFDSAFGVQEAEDAVTESMRRLAEQVKQQIEDGDKHAGSLEGQSEAALNNREILRDLTRGHGEVIEKMLESGASADEVRDKNEEFIGNLEELADQLGIDRDELDLYIDVLAAIPDEVSTSVSVDISGAEAALRRLNSQLRSTPGFGGFEVRHAGGLVGLGNRFASDEVPVLARRGEFVSTVSATQNNRAALEAANAGARLTVVGGGGGGSGGGGSVLAGGTFEGQLFLDSGALLGVVRGEIRASQGDLVRRVRAGSGAAR